MKLRRSAEATKFDGLIHEGGDPAQFSAIARKALEDGFDHMGVTHIAIPFADPEAARLWGTDIPQYDDTTGETIRPKYVFANQLEQTLGRRVCVLGFTVLPAESGVARSAVTAVVYPEV